MTTVNVTDLACWSARRLARARDAWDFTAAERARFEAHVAACRPCAARLRPLGSSLTSVLDADAERALAAWEARVPHAALVPARLAKQATGSGTLLDDSWNGKRREFFNFRALAAACALVAILAGALWLREAVSSVSDGIRTAEIPARGAEIAPAATVSLPSQFDVSYATIDGANAAVVAYDFPEDDAVILWLSSAS